MPYSTGDQALIRSDWHTTSLIINAVPKVVLATAEIDQVQFSYPLGDFTVTDTSADWLDIQPGQMFAIGTAPGLGDVTYGVVRKAPLADRFYMDAKSRGDPGYARSLIKQLLPGHYLTVYKYRPPWGLLSAIRGKKFYKDFDRPYSGEGASPPPLLRLGRHRQAFIDLTSGTASLDFSVSGYIWDKTLSTVTWNVDGGTITAGDENSLEITVEFEPGFYEVTCTGVDSAGRTRMAYRYVWINHPDPANTWAPFGYKHAWSISGDKQVVEGRRLSLEITGDFAPDELFPGQAFLLTETPRFNGQPLDDPDDMPTVHFFGYAGDKSITTSYRDRRTSIDLAGPLLRASNVVTATQQLTEVRSPKDWTECKPILSNPVGAAWYIAAYHAPYLIDGHDYLFDEGYLAQRARTFNFQELEIGGQYESLAERALGVIGARSDGTWRLVREPVYFDQVERDLLPTQWQWLPSDIEGALEWPVTVRMQTGKVSAYAFSFIGKKNSTAYESLAPGSINAQAGAHERMTPVVVTDFEGQTRLNAIAGHHFARLNNPAASFTIKADRNIDVAEPVDRDRWHELAIPASYDPEALGWGVEASAGGYEGRAVPVSVARQWAYDEGDLVKRLEIEFEGETYGQPGERIPITRGAGASQSNAGGSTGAGSPGPGSGGGGGNLDEKAPEFNTPVPVMLAVNDDGILGRSFTFTDPNVTWRKLTGFNGKCRDACIDFHSGYFSNPANPLGAFIITDNVTAGQVYIYYSTNILLENPTWSLRLTLSPTGYRGRARILVSRQEASFVFAAIKTDGGVYFTRSVNNGALGTWSTLAAVGVETPIDSSEYLAVDIYEQTQVICAPSGADDPVTGAALLAPYTASTKAGAFSAVSNRPTHYGAYRGALAVRNTTEFYIPMLATGTPDPVAPSTNIVNGSTNLSGIGLSVTATATINLGADYNLTGVTFERKFIYGNQLYGTRIEAVVIVQDAYNQVVGQATVEDCYIGTTGFGDGCDALSWVEMNVTAEELGISDLARRVSIRITMSWEADDDPGIAYADLQNVTFDGILETRETEREFYVVSTSGTWTAITPPGEQLPFGSYGIAVDTASTGNLTLLAEDENGFSFALIRASTIWNTAIRTPWIGSRRGANDLALLFGYNSIALSLNAASPAYNRVGNWVGAIGRLGLVECMTGVITV